MDRPLIAPNLSTYGKTYDFDGDLYRNQGINVEIPNNLFNLVANQHLVPTVAHITTTIAQDDTLDYFGPYTANDTNTKLVRLRKTIPLPFKYTSIF